MSELLGDLAPIGTGAIRDLCLKGWNTSMEHQVPKQLTPQEQSRLSLFGYGVVNQKGQKKRNTQIHRFALDPMFLSVTRVWYFPLELRTPLGRAGCPQLKLDATGSCSWHPGHWWKP